MDVPPGQADGPPPPAEAGLRSGRTIGLTSATIDLNALHGVTELLRSWGRHWTAVGTLQRRLPHAAQHRLQSLDADPEAILAQTVHLFAHEFPPEAVASIRG